MEVSRSEEEKMKEMLWLAKIELQKKSAAISKAGKDAEGIEGL